MRSAGRPLVTGVHALIYTPHADEVRAFIRDILGIPSIDSGGGWLIFALPPAELGVHPTDGPGSHELYLLCDDLGATMKALRKRGVRFAGRTGHQEWGITTTILLPGGAKLGLYQPLHPLAHESLAARRGKRTPAKKRRAPAAQPRKLRAR